MIAGVFSRVCTRLGMKASFKRAAMEPETLMSWAVTLRPHKVEPTTIRSSRAYVFGVSGQTEDGHDFRGNSDVVASLALDALPLADGDLRGPGR